MIAYIEGRILEKNDSSCIIVTSNGLGYEVYAPIPVLHDLPMRGEQCFLYTSQVFREDAQELFGFSTYDERETFRMLTTINRVGARTALSILSVYSPYDLRRIVAQEDMNALTKVSGIGKQTGQKIFLELQYKMKADVKNLQLGNFESTGHKSNYGTSTTSATGTNTRNDANQVFKDALTGLVNLGYEESHVVPLLKEVLMEQEDLDVSGALRASLKAIAKLK